MPTHATSTRCENSDVPRHAWLHPELQNEVTPEVTPELPESTALEGSRIRGADWGAGWLSTVIFKFASGLGL